MVVNHPLWGSCQLHLAREKTMVGSFVQFFCLFFRNKTVLKLTSFLSTEALTIEQQNFQWGVPYIDIIGIGCS